MCQLRKDVLIRGFAKLNKSEIAVQVSRWVQVPK